MHENLIIQRTLRVPASTGTAGDGTPVARQLDAAHLYLSSRPSFNRVEANSFTTADRVRALTERRYLTMSYLIDLWRAQTEVSMWDGGLPEEPVTFVGLEAPEGLPADSEIYTLGRLAELIPE
jgi:hypothetical protein